MQTTRTVNIRAVNTIRFLLSLFASCGALGAMAYAQVPAPPPTALMPSLTPATPHWRAVAESGRITYGKVTGITEATVTRGGEKHLSFTLKIASEGTLKRDLKDSPSVWPLFYETSDEPRYRDFVMSLPRAEQVVFFRDLDSGGLIRAPQAASDAIVAEIRNEVSNQALITAQFARLPAAKPDRFDKQVAALITTILDPTGLVEGQATPSQLDQRFVVQGKALKAMNGIIALGPDAVPSVIRQIKDPRSLPSDFVNQLDGLDIATFATQYPNDEPHAVTDLLAALIGKMLGPNGDSFRLRGGPSELVRRRVVDGWRVWLCYTMAESEARNKTANAERR